MGKGKKFLLKLLIVLTGMAIADVAVGGLMGHFYFRIRHGEQARTTYAVDSANPEILILGSSRASHHYIPAIIEDSLGMSCYNAGKDKQGVFYSLAILKAVCARHRPQGVILDITPFSFETKESALDQLSILLPYYRQHPEIRAIVDKRSGWEWLKTKSLLYCYNSLPLQILFNNISAEREAGAENGYVPLYNKWNPNSYVKESREQENSPADSTIVKAFEEIILIAKKLQIPLVVTVSPIYSAAGIHTQTMRLAKEICAGKGVYFFDFSQFKTLIVNANLFSDRQHLNNSGAVLFSGLLCNDLRPVFSKKGYSDAKSH